jgi:hypothetical protein
LANAANIGNAINVCNLNGSIKIIINAFYGTSSLLQKIHIAHRFNAIRLIFGHFVPVWNMDQFLLFTRYNEEHEWTAGGAGALFSDR